MCISLWIQIKTRHWYVLQQPKHLLKYLGTPTLISTPKKFSHKRAHRPI